MKKNEGLVLKQNTDFLRENLGKAVPPSMLTILSANINVFVDGILVGNKIGTDALAAINLSLPLQLFLYVAGSFVGAGTAINAAKAIGKGDVKNSLEFYRTAVYLSFFISIIITAAGLIFRNPLVAFLCPDETLRPMVTEYTVISLIGALSRIMIYIPLWYLRLDGRNVLVMIMMGVMSIGNIILDFIFVYIMNMGIFGAGLASVIATTAAFIMGALWLGSRRSSFHFRVRIAGGNEPLKPGFKGYIINNKRDWRELAKAGIPSALNNLLATLRIIIINYVFMTYGGSSLVAVFSAVNGIAGFGECITLGIPQASSAMLGVYSGEKDNGSMSMLVSLEWKIGLTYCLIFIGIVAVGADFIGSIYGLPGDIRIPLLYMAVSTIPGLWCSILLSLYNMTGKTIWSDAIIVSRCVAMTAAGLFFAVIANISLFSFFVFSETATILLWLFMSHYYVKNHKETSRYLLLDDSMEREGHILNFSVDFSNESICGASEKISDFCSENGMLPKQTMTLQLSLEEIMTLIARENINKGQDKELSFDLRAYSLFGVTGIRIRYGGIPFNPFAARHDMEDDVYMGVEMIKKLVEDVLYQRTFGVNTLQVLLKE